MESHLSTILLELFLILVVGRFFAELSFRFKAPPVVGEVLAGLILGPSFLGIVEVNELVKIFAEIGIILLLFEVGFEADIEKLKKEGFNASVVAFFGALFPFVLGFLVSYYMFNLSLFTSLFIGGTLTATSIGISLRVLKDLGLHTTKMAQVVIGAAVLDDILGVIVLASLVQLVAQGTIEIISLVKLLGLMFLFLILAPFIAFLIANILHLFGKNHTQIPGYIPIVVVSFILGFSIVAHYVGLPEIIGAFIAGIALSKKFDIPFISNLFATTKKEKDFFSRRVEAQVSPIVSLFAPIFFVSVGLSINLKEIDLGSEFLYVAGGIILVVAVLGKLVGAFFVKQTKIKDKLLIGISMIPRGEVGLIFAEFGKNAKIFTTEIYSMLIFVIIITTLVPPFVIRGLFKKEKKT